MSRQPIDRFDESFKEWGRRPPSTPAREAAGQVLNRLAAERSVRTARGLRPWIAAAAAASLALVAVHLFLPATTAPVPVVEEAMAPPVQEGVVLMWLDSETPLYLTLNVPSDPKGNPTS